MEFRNFRRDELGFSFCSHPTEKSYLKKLKLRLREIYNPQTEKKPPSIEKLIQKYSHLVEKVILQKPHWYFWSNRRWKTRPSGDNEQVYIN